MSYNRDRTTRHTARQIQLLYALHRESYQRFAYLITEEDISLANQLEPCWTHKLGDSEVLHIPWEWTFKQGSLSEVLGCFRVNAQELLAQENDERQESD
ncbi:hypothetical protein FHETE_7139 [Fusarium heterosporum]|uniref:Uncharacterized protein n=1 Tax=Fusarium heterosporum TaxID=42747 RepID=A0A8H5T6X5_FUSHE|nr:hypothetical protein FHETE_7139 [Fusarium heterosporum]